ncbi:MAG: hypothetical protein JWO38_6697 [Gemmataceae bacterium]|nr:hypothetical protein [Gemmataceae bacterium]
MHSILFVGAALVGLPIILHLIMKQEPKRLPFPAFRFLKQRLKTNQRKLRLRHFLLLALRMLLIALFCLALYQPSVLNEGFIPLHGDQPAAVVVVVDTSPSMGYADGDKTRLEEACQRAIELINDLPDGSRVAVVETGDPGGDWLPSVSDARTKLTDLAKRAPKPGQSAPATGGGQSVTAALATAYQLLRTVDEQTEAADTLPRLVAVFTDRAASSWDPSRVDDLKKLRDSVPDPKPAHAVVDVGTDKPVNVAILAAEMTEGRAQTVPADQPVSVTVTLAAVGLDAKATVHALLDETKIPPREVDIPDGQTRTVAFEFKDLKPGAHQVRFELEKKDALMADNTRFFTFRVVEPRKVLAISDNPGDPARGVVGDPYFWVLAVDATREFSCDVKKPDQVAAADLGGYEAVTLLSVARPSDQLWGEIRKYVEGGGKLIVVPGGETTSLDAYNGEAATKLMPGALKRVVETAKEFPAPKDPKAKDRRAGVVWAVFAGNDDRAIQHPMLAPIKEWKAKGNVDADRNPRPVWKYWEVERRGDGAAVVVTYDTDDDPAKRHPAVLERTFLDAKDKAPKGKVLLLTTRMDMPDDKDPWNNYWDGQNSWAVAFPQLLLRYAAGAAADANFNYPTGQVVTVPLAKLLGGKRDNLVLTGPGVAGTDSIVRPTERQTELRLGPPRTNAAGNYTLTPATADGPTAPPRWQEGFSLNVPAEESTLDKVPVEGIEALTGANTVVPVGKNLELKTALDRQETFRHPVDLFPWLLIAVLLLLAVEGLLANRFYRRPK